MTRTLVVTNDFPPRQGGIQTFVAALLARRPPESVVVLASDSPGSAAYDAALPYPVVRRPTGMLLPTRATARAAADLARRYGCDSAFFGAAAPLGLLAPALRAAGVAAPGGRHARARDRVGGAAGLAAVAAAHRRRPRRPHLHQRVHPPPAGAGARATGPGWRSSPRESTSTASRRTPTARRCARGTDWAPRPVVVCVSRLVARKGQDVLVAGWPRVLARHPGARLLLVGGGPAEASLRRAVDRLGIRDSVVLTGPVAPEELPGYYAAGDVFAMPCRTRRAGLDVEGLGMVFLEAAACGRPVVAGTSGGAPEAVREGITGHVVEPRSPGEVADAIAGLLDDPTRARAMGAAGRAWVEERWSWSTIAATFADLLEKH